MTAGIDKYYFSLHENMRSSTKAALAENISDISAAHQTITDLSVLITLLKGRSEHTVLAGVLHDASAAVLESVMGAYRQAFTSQRVILENGIASIFYSAHPIRMKHWLAGTEDVSWRRITADSEGVYTCEFFTAFAPELLDQLGAYRDEADLKYSCLSDFVHKNVKVFKLDKLGSKPNKCIDG